MSFKMFCDTCFGEIPSGNSFWSLKIIQEKSNTGDVFDRHFTHDQKEHVCQKCHSALLSTLYDLRTA